MQARANFAILVLCQSILISSTPTVTYSTKTVFNQPQTVLVSSPSSLKATVVNATATATTAPHLEETYIYKVPATLLTLRLWPGFHIDPSVLEDTISLAKAFTTYSIDQGYTGPLPREYDPFESDGGYGAVVSLTSVIPVRRLTWKDLNDAMQGVWDFFVRQQHSFEAWYEVWYGTQDELLIGRGRVEAAGVWVMAGSLTQKPKGCLRDECLEE